MAAEVRAFQIFYDEKTRALLDPDFEPLDNTRNERPDWYEYWPIRSYLTQNRLDESAYYGFVSPMFREKTRLGGKQVKDFVAQADGADIVTFSPYPCHGACFFNIFEQGQFFHVGLFDIASRFIPEIDPGTDLSTLVTHSRNTVLSNFFFAKPGFWRRWLGILDRLFGHAENSGSALYADLNRPTTHLRGDGVSKTVQMKVFLMERIASFLLATTREFTAANYPPFEMPVSPPFAGHLPDLIVMDALKIAYSRTGDVSFLEIFRGVRDRAIAAAWPPAQPQA